eukprot:1424257-Prorocentrum_lima.AAC.1
MVQNSLNLEKQQVATLKTELHQARSQRRVAPRTLDNPIRTELEDRLQATQAEVNRIRQAEQEAQ